VLPAGIDFRDLLADLYPMLGAQAEFTTHGYER